MNMTKKKKRWQSELGLIPFLIHLSILWGANMDHDNVNTVHRSTGGFEDPALYTSWLSPDAAFTSWKSPVPFNKYEKSATLVSNSQALLRPLDNMVRNAWNMFASRWVGVETSTAHAGPSVLSPQSSGRPLCCPLFQGLCPSVRQVRDLRGGLPGQLHVTGAARLQLQSAVLMNYSEECFYFDTIWTDENINGLRSKYVYMCICMYKYTFLHFTFVLKILKRDVAWLMLRG